ncbi:hypothetical protein L6164_022724 [Bauhinia variegata]|uniref:Uncharacterized protein n=1 Tax=Bauhinia variegata TaxID=167791 RepID=A0ACB9MHY3_BAUVA|nr:hypothetical protein L6164_022724 [Bauhinia variegata]
MKNYHRNKATYTCTKLLAFLIPQTTEKETLCSFFQLRWMASFSWLWNFCFYLMSSSFGYMGMQRQIVYCRRGRLFSLLKLAFKLFAKIIARNLGITYTFKVLEECPTPF